MGWTENERGCLLLTNLITSSSSLTHIYSLSALIRNCWFLWTSALVQETFEHPELWEPLAIKRCSNAILSPPPWIVYMFIVARSLLSNYYTTLSFFSVGKLSRRGLILTPRSIERFSCHFQKQNITLSFWEAIKQYDITLFDCLIVFFATLHNTQRTYPTSYLLISIFKRKVTWWFHYLKKSLSDISIHRYHQPNTGYIGLYQ